MAFPTATPYLVIGAGIHGLSTAYHLAVALKRTRKGSGSDILVVDKSGIAAGASGIACGVVRNNYFQPAMRELMAHSVRVWESDPKAYQYNAVGYMQISSESMRDDVRSIYQQQKAIGYESVFVEGAKESDAYMKDLFSDWQAKNITSVLHEKKGGYAHNAAAIYALAEKAENEGVRILSGVTVKGMTFANGASSAVTGVDTDRGHIDCDYLVIGAGPWVRDFWKMAELPDTVTIKSNNGEMHDGIPMWRFWQLEEGVLGVEPDVFKTNDGKMPPVMHVDTDAPLYSAVDGSIITESMWGIYYKPDFNFGGIQGGAMPYKVETPVEQVQIDPYGPASAEFVSSPEFAHMWVSALAHCHKRFEGTMPQYHKEPSGGIGCFTPDSFPVFEAFRENVYIIADSNHGYKMIGVGALVAEEVIGNKSSLLKPFRLGRYAAGELHPVSNSPYPWS
ncbi:MAG: FAD-binding oxidoreductase [Mesorhizobium sp.]|uniref:NAD(P)/FAD-dependent oxidoreductase n=1 Tax=Mesorhizobium sp. TaxID=1871066 RepID=UPI000FE603C1|nr:FAD-binding oxidoreductase [Mesorhizobium sp.]RWB94144.1 MAG: FAD-binding oxidoreductase [Mesorhizobium sp.]RWE17418.1 MAG: FAD-binding oxidoreductase [Mesorhizobium sp.]TIS44425.1 MAG: FAD-binding oxidoreductase [Mesorhizobium sp.]